MKKIFFTLMLVFVFISCGSQKYIDAVKDYKLNEVQTVKNIEISTATDLASFYIHRITGADYSDIKNNLSYEIGGKLDENRRIVNIKFNDCIVNVEVYKDQDNKYIVDTDTLIARYNDYTYTKNDFLKDIIDSKINEGLNNLNNIVDNLIYEFKKNF